MRRLRLSDPLSAQEKEENIGLVKEVLKGKTTTVAGLRGRQVFPDQYSPAGGKDERQGKLVKRFDVESIRLVIRN